MISTLNSLERKVRSAQELKQVVRTMKSLAAANIRPYEQAVQALEEYYQVVELGLLASFRDFQVQNERNETSSAPRGPTAVVVFGSDQGLVGQFNESLVAFFRKEASNIVGEKIILPIGERITNELQHECSKPAYRVPDCVAGIIPLVSQILLEVEEQTDKRHLDQIFIFHNRPNTATLYEPVQLRMLPVDKTWFAGLRAKKWPTRKIPEVFSPKEKTSSALIRGYLFVCLFRACAESLASENASRLASMRRAEKNINDSLEQLQLQYHQLRQNTIDDELFDVISDFEALASF